MTADIGYGVDTPNGGIASVLLEGATRVESDLTCSYLDSPIICTYSFIQPICFGDSGGALIYTVSRMFVKKYS